ncbi:MAG: hypothetical protein HP495_07030, partial [Nitrospira sp.]|nr:hypothetical protein [Nitrospira sp.]
HEVTATIVRFVDNIKISVLGVAGVAGLFYTTYSLIDKIEQALNVIWQVKQGRTWERKFADYLSAVLVGPVLVMTAFGLLASLQSHTLVQYLVQMEPFGTLLVWSGEIIPFLMSIRSSPTPKSRSGRQSSVASPQPFCGSRLRRSLLNSSQRPPITVRSIQVLPCSFCSSCGSTLVG